MIRQQSRLLLLLVCWIAVKAGMFKIYYLVFKRFFDVVYRIAGINFIQVYIQWQQLRAGGIYSVGKLHYLHNL